MKYKLLALLLFFAPPAFAQMSTSVFIEDMTWLEVRDKIANGATIAIIPIGGTEQSGPHMANGKHNFIVRQAAGEVARAIGGALVTPVVSYSPVGRIYPPEGHMQFAGTLSVRAETLAMVIEDVATSLKQHGFRLICFIGDNAGSQNVQQQVAERLNNSWASHGVQVLHVSSYGDMGMVRRWADSNGSMAVDPIAHAGMTETSELMSVSPQHVRNQLVGTYSERDYRTSGSTGDASQSSAAFGRGVLGAKINAAVQQIKLAASKP